MTDTSNPTHDQAVSDYYTDADVIPTNSPSLQPHRPQLVPIDTQPRTFLFHQVSPESSPGSTKSNSRMKLPPTRADAVLVGEIDGNRNPGIASEAGRCVLPPDTDEEDPPSDASDSSSHSISLRRHGGGSRLPQDGRAKSPRAEPGTQGMVLDSLDHGDMGAAFDLKSLAAGALAVAVTDLPPDPVNAGPTPPNSESDVVKERPIPPPLSQPIVMRPGEPSKDDRRPERQFQHPAPSPFSPRSMYSPRESIHVPLAQPLEMMSPPSGPAVVNGGLPPIQMQSPRSDTVGSTPSQTPLPSIRATFPDLNRLSLPRSPSSNLPRLPSMHHVSPPISPADTFRGGPLSPHPQFAPMGSPPYYQPGSGFHRSPRDYPSSATLTPGSDHSSSTAATSIADKMSIEGLTIQTASYVCKFQGCTAAPFQTQYLLNSHANVHSSARPHYCPVAGCPRSEGGKGFKRKNEMIRHGLVHDSPGYVCPFCPDREHKYPRPDNLQRYDLEVPSQ